jgi:putative ABC transport system permease protein
MRSFVALRKANLGLRADHVFETAVVLPPERYKTPEQVTGFFRPLLARLKALPGVVDAAESSAVPPYSFDSSKLEIAGNTHQDDWQTLLETVSQQYFRALRIELKGGRTFSQQEVNDARKVAVVNQTFVRRYFPGETPLGSRVRLLSLETADPRQDSWFEIIGVVRDVTNSGLQAPIEPEVWIPYTTAGSEGRVLLVRTAQDPSTMMEVVRKEVWAADSEVGLAYPSTLEDRLSKILYAGPMFGFVLMTIFGCIGLILVTVGVYSVLAYSTAQKTHEIGIRMALGAEDAEVLRMVVRTGLRLVIAGLAIGIVMSLALGGLIGAQLEGVAAYDPATLAATTLLLTMTAAFACWIPARRAARVDPMVALRSQ